MRTHSYTQALLIPIKDGEIIKMIIGAQDTIVPCTPNNSYSFPPGPDADACPYSGTSHTFKS
jgi:hypothetical protein